MSRKMIARQTRMNKALTITDTIECEEDLIIEGRIRTGKIDAKDNTLLIGSESDVQTDLYADTIIIQGTFTGKIFAKTLIDIQKNAVVNGDMTSPKFKLDPDCRFNGRLTYA